MTGVKKLKTRLLKDPKVKKAYEAMEPEFAIAKVFISARVKAGLTQEEVAKRMGTTQSAIARLEAGGSLPSLKSLYRYAEATGTKPSIRLLSA